jgi:hypothetical protein
VSRQWRFHDCGQNQTSCLTSGCASVRSPSFSGLASRIEPATALRSEYGSELPINPIGPTAWQQP